MSEARAGGSTEFAGRMLRTMNEAALALMVSVGHRTGLFDVMAAMPAATSAEIAARALLDAVHDQARPDLVLAGIAEALRPGGVYLCVGTSASSKVAENLDHRLGPFLYTVSCVHCMTVSLADGGMGLGAMWGEQTARKMPGEAGFASIEAAHLDGDIVNTYIIATKG